MLTTKKLRKLRLVDVPCVSCRDLEDCVGLGCGTGPCNYCNGTGFVKALKVIDSPLPLNDPKYSRFFNSLQEFINNDNEHQFTSKAI